MLQSESGTFSSVILPKLDPGLHWDTSLLYSQGIVRVSIPGDVNSDGMVNGQDIAVIASHWLQTYGGSRMAGAAAVPEPSAICLLVLGVIATLIRRR